MKNEAPMKLIGVGHSEGQADAATIEKYREQMKRMFGCSSLPAVQYKGELIPARIL